MFEFFTIGGGEYFVDIFNGLAMLTKSGDYMDVIKISAVLAFMIALFNAALMGSLYDSSKWFLTTLVITQVMLFPKATVHITDKTNPALMGAKVDNVPYVIAYASSTTSQIGYALTKQFETAYSLPNDLQYSENGMVFGANLMQAMFGARITNPNLAASIDSFSRECIFFDLQLGIYSFSDLKNSDDIWGFVKMNQTENRFVTYTNYDGEVSYPTCKAATALLEVDWKQEFQSIGNLGFFAKKPDLTKAILMEAAPLANEYFLNVSQTSQQILQQSMMANAIADAVENQEAESQIQLFQNARAAAQTKSMYQTMGTQAGVLIPIMKIVMEAVFYGIFPLIVILSLIPNLTATVLKGYFGTFLWLASWGPFYTIFHRLSLGHGKTYTLSLDNGVGMTLATQNALQQTMSDIAATAGYMSLSIPVLAYGIARMGVSGVGMATSFLSGVQGVVSNVAQEGTTGNLSYGNVSVGSRNVSSGVSIMNDAGQVTHRNQDGSTSLDNTRAESRLGVDLHGSSRMESALSNQISQEQSLGQSKSMQAMESQSHGFEKLLNDHRSIESSKGFEQNFSSEEKSAFSKINNAVNDFAKEHSISREKSAEIFGRIGGQVNASTKAGRGMGANLDAGGAFQYSGKSSDQDHYKEAINYSNQHHLSKDFQVMQSALESNRFNLTDSKGESINQNFSTAASLNKEASQHFEAAERYSASQQFIKSHSADVDKNYNQEFWRDLESKYGTHQAADITNPNNLDKSTLNREIDNFMSSKIDKISDVQDPNLEAKYNQNTSTFAAQNSVARSNHQPYSFSENKNAVDNSGLQSSTNKSFGDTQQIINDAKNQNSDLGNQVTRKVKSEQDDGLI